MVNPRLDSTFLWCRHLAIWKMWKHFTICLISTIAWWPELYGTLEGQDTQENFFLNRSVMSGYIRKIFCRPICKVLVHKQSHLWTHLQGQDPQTKSFLNPSARSGSTRKIMNVNPSVRSGYTKKIICEPICKVRIHKKNHLWPICTSS